MRMKRKRKLGGEKNIKIVEMEEWSPSVGQGGEDHGGSGEEYHEKPKEYQEEPVEYHEEPEEEYHEPSPPPRRRSLPAFEERRPIESPMVRTAAPKVSDVFVKIDKFHQAKKALGEVKLKLSEIDGLVRKIRDTKMREEQEIAAWEKDMDHIRARMKDVTETIFEKVE